VANPGRSLLRAFDQSSLKSAFFTDDEIAYRNSLIAKQHQYPYNSTSKHLLVLSRYWFNASPGAYCAPWRCRAAKLLRLDDPSASA
jgi:hypothetical protein